MPWAFALIIFLVIFALLMLVVSLGLKMIETQRKIKVGGNFVKEYWGEGSNRARNWQRYHEGGASGLGFEEGVDGYVPYAGTLKDNLDLTLDKIRATMVSCGACSVAELHDKARLTLASAVSIREGSVHDVDRKENEIIPSV